MIPRHAAGGKDASHTGPPQLPRALIPAFQRRLTAPDPEADEPKIGMDVFDNLVEVVRRCGVAEDDAFDYGVILWMALHGRAAVASAMPDLVTAHINACVLMMAERAADLIAGKPTLPRAAV